MTQQYGTTGQQTGQTSQQVGQQPQQTGQTGQQMGLSLWDVQTPQEQTALNTIVQSVEVCEWCTDQCIQEASPQMTECIRLCRDVSEFGRTTLALMARNSPYAQTAADAFLNVANACAQECSRHQQAHCQDCAQTLGQATEAVQQYLSSGQQMGQTQPVQQMGRSQF